MEKNNKIKMYTDGACKGNPGIGGWGVFIQKEDDQIDLNGFDLKTTNNKMELTAVIEGLKSLPLKTEVTVITDSKYVKDGISHWIFNWKKNGWKTSSGKSVQNLDLWQKIDQLRINGLVMEYVKGHSGDKQNDRVDKIATNYCKGISLKSNSKHSESSVEFFEKSAPAEIQELFSRNELIQKFAEKKYLLSSPELTNLLGEENHLKIKQYSLFEWRNWILIPKGEKYWIIEKKNPDFL